MPRTNDPREAPAELRPGGGFVTRDVVHYRAAVDVALAGLELEATSLAVMRVYEALGVRSVQPPTAIVLDAPMPGAHLDIFLYGQERLFDNFARRGVHQIPLSYHLVRFWASFDIWRSVVDRTSHPHLVVTTLLRSVPMAPQEMAESASMRVVSQWTGFCLQDASVDDKRAALLRIGEHLFGVPWSMFIGSAIEKVEDIYASIVNERPPFVAGLSVRNQTIDQTSLPALGA